MTILKKIMFVVLVVGAGIAITEFVIRKKVAITDLLPTKPNAAWPGDEPVEP